MFFFIAHWKTLILYILGDAKLTNSDSKKRKPAPLTLMVKSPKKSTGHSKSKSKTLRPSTPRQKTFIIATQKLPLVVGKFI